MTRLKPEKLLSTGYEAGLQAVEMLREESLLRLLLRLRHEAQLRLRALPLPGATLRLPEPLRGAPPLLEPAVRVAEALLPCHKPSMVFRSGRDPSAESRQSI